MPANPQTWATRIQQLERQVAALSRRMASMPVRRPTIARRRNPRLCVTADPPASSGETYPKINDTPNTYWITFVDGQHDGRGTSYEQEAGDLRTGLARRSTEPKQRGQTLDRTLWLPPRTRCLALADCGGEQRQNYWWLVPLGAPILRFQLAATLAVDDPYATCYWLRPSGDISYDVCPESFVADTSWTFKAINPLMEADQRMFSGTAGKQGYAVFLGDFSDSYDDVDSYTAEQRETQRIKYPEILQLYC